MTNNLETIIEKAQDGVRIISLSDNKEYVINGVIGIHPNVGFNFSADSTTPAGIDGRSGKLCYGNRGFLYSECGVRWDFIN